MMVLILLLHAGNLCAKKDYQKSKAVLVDMVGNTITFPDNYQLMLKEAPERKALPIKKGRLLRARKIHFVLCQLRYHLLVIIKAHF